MKSQLRSIYFFAGIKEAAGFTFSFRIFKTAASGRDIDSHH